MVAVDIAVVRRAVALHGDDLRVAAAPKAQHRHVVAHVARLAGRELDVLVEQEEVGVVGKRPVVDDLLAVVLAVVRRELGVDGFSLTPTFSKDTESYNLIVDTSVTTINVQASAADTSASVNGVLRVTT